MKTPISYLILLVLLSSCVNNNHLVFESIEHGSNNCVSCPEISIHLPKALGNKKISSAVNTALREEVISLLNFDNTNELADLKSAISSFTQEFLSLKKLYPKETAKWEAKIKADVVYEDSSMLSLEIDSYIFTGGAHGYSSTRLLNFDKIKGREVDALELFRDRDEFQQFAETKFRIQEKIPAGQPINSTGFMFERDSFYLPENIGLTQLGIKLHYNQYEVASYADGPIEITLLYPEVKKYLSQKIKS